MSNMIAKIRDKKTGRTKILQRDMGYREAPGAGAFLIDEREPMAQVGCEIVQVPIVRLDPCPKCGTVMSSPAREMVELAGRGEKFAIRCRCGQALEARKKLIFSAGRG